MRVETHGGRFVFAEESLPCIGGPRHGESRGIQWSCLPPVGYVRERIESEGEFIAEVWAFEGMDDKQFLERLCDWSERQHANPD